jgi:hypothetical protein
MFYVWGGCDRADGGMNDYCGRFADLQAICDELMDDRLEWLSIAVLDEQHDLAEVGCWWRDDDTGEGEWYIVQDWALRLARTSGGPEGHSCPVCGLRIDAGSARCTRCPVCRSALDWTGAWWEATNVVIVPVSPAAMHATQAEQRAIGDREFGWQCTACGLSMACCGCARSE